MHPKDSPSQVLQRNVGLFGATMMGMGSIVGTGVFVSIGIAAGIAGPAVIAAIVLAAGVATCNALNSATTPSTASEMRRRFLGSWTTM